MTTCETHKQKRYGQAYKRAGSR